MFYGLVGLGAPKTAWLRGGALGLAMGLGVLTLPPAFGVGKRETGRTPTTKAGTLIWYILGGILAALTFMASHEHKRKVSLTFEASSPPGAVEKVSSMPPPRPSATIHSHATEE
jgi:hypothetical protein